MIIRTSDFAQLPLQMETDSTELLPGLTKLLANEQRFAIGSTDLIVCDHLKE